MPRRDFHLAKLPDCHDAISFYQLPSRDFLLLDLFDLGYGILEHHVDEPLRLAGAVYSVGVGVTPGECRQSHAAVIVRVEAACTISTGQVDRIHIV